MKQLTSLQKPDAMQNELGGSDVALNGGRHSTNASVPLGKKPNAEANRLKARGYPYCTRTGPKQPGDHQISY